ncbi:unnamed protein product [Rhizophagus irregularis]|uniref:Uncharacterized protein n=1 Tax=Rhizophagus irregularis TaxID=588596 RepID=A0A916E4D8_9GLOM|nr:unnamed protein product [Rhizophagus irregularis]
MHVLNLAVNKGLNLISESVKKARSLMSYIKTSQTGTYLTDFDRINIDDTIVLLSPIERATHFLSASNSLIDESASFTITHYFGKFLPLIIIFLVINNAPHLIIPNMVFLVVPHDVDFQFLDTQELSGKEFVMQKYYLL